MEEKRNELKSAKQERLILEIMSKLSESDPSLYYLSTIEIATEIQKVIDNSNNAASVKLSTEQKQLMSGLDRHAIQMILGLHPK